MVGLEADGAAGGPLYSESRSGRNNILSTAFVRDSSQDSACSGSPDVKATSPRATVKEHPCAKQSTSAIASPRVSLRGVRPPALREALDAEADSGAGPESRVQIGPLPSASDEDGKRTEAYFIGTPPGSASRPGRRIGAEVPPPTVAIRSLPSPPPPQSAGSIAWPASPRDSLRPRRAMPPILAFAAVVGQASAGGPACCCGGRWCRGSSPSPGRRDPGVSGAAAVAAVTVAMSTPNGQTFAGSSSSLRWASPPARSTSPGGDGCPTQNFDDGQAVSRSISRSNRGPREARTPLTAPPRIRTTSRGRQADVSARRLFDTPGVKNSGNNSPPPLANSAVSGASGRLRTPSAGRDVASSRLSPTAGYGSRGASRETSPPRASASGDRTGSSKNRSSPDRSLGLLRQHLDGGQIAAAWEQAASATMSPREGISRASGGHAGFRSAVGTSASQRKSPPRPRQVTSQDALGSLVRAPPARISCAGSATPSCSSRGPRGCEGKDGGPAPRVKTSTARR